MYQKIIIAACFLLFSSYAIAQATPKKQALLVGVANYKGKSKDLPEIYQDIKKMKKLFVSWGFDVKILRDKQSLELEQWLDSYANLTKNDTFIFYYTGHGSSVKDTNRDEADGNDETIVLSDGRKHIHFLDDDLDFYFSRIKAKKLIIMDSCHSGTANKGISGDKIRAKVLPSEDVKTVYRRKNTPDKGEKIKSGDAIFLAAAKDAEDSLITSSGSLFTTNLYHLFSQSSYRKTPLASVFDTLEYNIVSYCIQNKKKRHHPQLSASASVTDLRKLSIKQYLMLK